MQVFIEGFSLPSGKAFQAACLRVHWAARHAPRAVDAEKQLHLRLPVALTTG